MKIALDTLLGLLATALVVLGPGWPLAVLIDRRSRVAAAMRPAVALALGVPVLTIASALTLTLELGIVWFAALMAAATIGATLAAWSRTRGSQRTLSRSWLAQTPLAVHAIAASSAVIALACGLWAWNDSLYHIGQARKLLVLDHPTFTNTLQFGDATAHPGYLVPVWQHMLALVSWVAHIDPIVAAWVAPGVLLPVMTYAAAGLGQVLGRGHVAVATATAAAWLGIHVASMLPFPNAIHNAVHPGLAAADVLIPVLAAAFLTAVRITPGVARTGVDRGMLVLCAAATFGIGMLHGSYLVFAALLVVGYLLAWAVRAPWPRAVVARHAAAACVVLATAVVSFAILAPGLLELEGVGRTAAEELASDSAALNAGKNFVDLEALMRPGLGGYHLRADQLVVQGGLALLGLLVVPLLVRRRDQGAWLLVGSTTLVLLVALTNPVFPQFVHLVTLDQARRIGTTLLLAPALAIGLVACTDRALALLRGPTVTRSRRVAGALIVAATFGALWFTVREVPALIGYAGEQIAPPWLVWLPAVALFVAFVALVVQLVRRIIGRRTSPEPRVDGFPAQPLPRRFAGGIAAVLVLAAIAPGVVDDWKLITDRERIVGLPLDLRAAELRFFSPQAARELQDLPDRSIVLADPRSRDPYLTLAVAPVYVVSSVPRHTAFTPGNRVPERFATALSFFEQTNLDDELRRQILLDERVDAVVIHPKASPPARHFLDTTPGIRKAAHGKHQDVYLIDRDALACTAASESDSCHP